MLKQFVEDEAELSGSEVESDENLDLDEEDDYLEMEAGDNDVTLNQDELRDQVGRVHLWDFLLVVSLLHLFLMVSLLTFVS